MEYRNKIQAWSAKRVDHMGIEYQIDSVFNEARFLDEFEGCYPENVAKMLSEKTVTHNGETVTVYTWMSYRIEHNAVEVTNRCGHVTVVTDENVTDGKSRAETIEHEKCLLCTKCHAVKVNRQLDENENASHLMNPGELNAL